MTIDAAASIRAQLWDGGFRPVPVYNADHPGPSPGKRPLGDGWRAAAQADPPFCVRNPPVAHALNTGILCDGLRAIDIDIEDADTVKRIRAMAVDRFGETSIRMRRNSARCLLLYRAATGEPPKVVITGRDGGKVEILGAGQQFVAFGRHPSGADLEWFPEAPGEIAVTDLPAVTEDAILAFLVAVAPLIEATPPNALSTETRTAGEPQADPLRLVAALAAIQNTGPADWEAWNRIGMALWAATGGSALGAGMWHEWSRRNPAYDASATQERWDHYADSPPTSIGAGTLFHLAGMRRDETAPEPPPDWWDSFEADIEPAELAPGEVPQPPPELPQPPQSSVIDPREWTAPAPLREWLVPDWIPIGYVTGLYGDGGVGKSLLSQQLMTCVSLGLPFLGLPVTAGRAFGMMCEDDPDELHRRQEAINRALGVEPQHLENLRYSSRVGMDNLLMTFDNENKGLPTKLFKSLVAYLTQFRPRLVVIDTIADTFGGNEIARAHARQYVQGIGGNIARAFNCAVVFAGHPSVSGMASKTGTGGSTAWSNTFRSRLYLTRPEGKEGEDGDQDERLLSRMKANYAPTSADIKFRYDNGAFALAGAEVRDRPAIDWDTINAVFDEIDRAWKAKDPWSLAPQTRREGRYLPLWAATMFGVNEKMFLRACEKWMAQKFLASRVFDAHTKKTGLCVLRRLQP